MSKNKAHKLAPVFVLLLAAQSFFGQITAADISYERLLAASAKQRQESHGFDEVQEAIKVIGAGGENIYASEVTAHLRKNFPAVDPKAAIRIPSEMRDALIFKGSDYERLVKNATPVLAVGWLDKKVVPLLYKSERPVIALAYPNAIIFSTRAIALLTDVEIQGQTAHELCHLIAHDLFKRAVDSRDNRTLRLLELFCDAGAASILETKGKDPQAVITGLYKQQDVLQHEFGQLEFKNQDHPIMADRERLNKELVRQFRLVATR